MVDNHSPSPLVMLPTLITDDREDPHPTDSCSYEPINDALEIHARELTEDRPGFEGSIKAMPRLAWSRPSDRANRRKILEGRLRIAQEHVAMEAMVPMLHGRCAILGLVFLEVIRTTAWLQGTLPGYSVFSMHFLTTTADLACLICSLPLYIYGTQSQCVMNGCLGPLLTLVFAMSLVDTCALGAYCIVASPRPMAPGARSYADALEACAGVWEFSLVASVALELALCASSWRIYRGLRVNGLYPPGNFPIEENKVQNISMLEMMCEAEDLEFCELNCETVIQHPLLSYPACATMEERETIIHKKVDDAVVSGLEADKQAVSDIDVSKIRCMHINVPACDSDDYDSNTGDSSDEAPFQEMHNTIIRHVSRNACSREMATQAVSRYFPPRTSSRQLQPCTVFDAHMLPDATSDAALHRENIDDGITKL